MLIWSEPLACKLRSESSSRVSDVHACDAASVALRMHLGQLGTVGFVCRAYR